jgi:gliding motility-associated-like protein
MKRFLFFCLVILIAGNLKAQCWKEVAGSFGYSAGIKTDGTLWIWGKFNIFLFGSIVNSTVPVQLGTGTNWTAISTGNGHLMAIQANGTLWGLGENYAGQLGNGSSAASTTLVQVGAATNWVSVDADNGYTIALKSNGTLWGWGSNGLGQLTNTAGGSIPAQIGTDTDWQSFSTDHGFTTVAIKTTGAMWAWGNPGSGNLGLGPWVAGTVLPTRIGTANDWRNISVGYEHCLALKTNGTLWAWGVNSFGELGDGTNAPKTTPVQIGTANDWQTVSASKANYSLALKTNGTLWSWGGNAFGQLGIGTTVNTNAPSQVGTATNWQIISAGSGQSQAIKTDASLWGWGDNSVGQLGDGTTVSRSSPTGVLSFLMGVQASDTSICEGIQVTLTASGAATYTWTGGVSNGVPFVPTATAVYTVMGSDALGCYSATTTAVTVIPSTTVTANASTTMVCMGETVTLSGSGGTSYAWSHGVVDGTSFAPGATTTYAVADSSGCSNTASITVSVLPLPMLSITATSASIIEGEQANLTANSSTATYSWFPAGGLSCSDCATPVASPPETTTYCVRTSDGTCSNTVCVIVSVEAFCEGDGFFLPTAFSPNGDGNNDVFCVQGKNRCITGFQMIIYDRWGEKMFESSDLSFCWDGTYRGKTLGPDVFVYYIKAQHQNQKEITKKGNVTLIK